MRRSALRLTDAAAKLGRRRRSAEGRQQQRARLAKLTAAELTCGHHDRRQAGARHSAARSSYADRTGALRGAGGAGGAGGGGGGGLANA